MVKTGSRYDCDILCSVSPKVACCPKLIFPKVICLEDYLPKRSGSVLKTSSTKNLCYCLGSLRIRGAYGPGVVSLAGRRATAPFGRHERRHRDPEISPSLSSSRFLSSSRPRTGIAILSGTRRDGEGRLEWCSLERRECLCATRHRGI